MGLRMMGDFKGKMSLEGHQVILTGITPFL